MSKELNAYALAQIEGKKKVEALPDTTDLAQIQITRDEEGKAIGFTIEAKSKDQIDVINLIRDRIFFGGNPRYDGREGGCDESYAGKLKFKFYKLK